MGRLEPWTDAGWGEKENLLLEGKPLLRGEKENDGMRGTGVTKQGERLKQGRGEKG